MMLDLPLDSLAFQKLAFWLNRVNYFSSFHIFFICVSAQKRCDFLFLHDDLSDLHRNLAIYG